MKLATRESTGRFPRRTVDVDFPEIGETFRLREMSGTERDKFEVAVFTEKDGKRQVDALYLRARLVALCWIGEDGQRIYADDEVHMLSDALPAGILAKLFEAAQTLNGLSQTAVEDAGKNSASAPSGGSPSA